MEIEYKKVFIDIEILREFLNNDLNFKSIIMDYYNDRIIDNKWLKLISCKENLNNDTYYIINPKTTIFEPEILFKLPIKLCCNYSDILNNIK